MISSVRYLQVRKQGVVKPSLLVALTGFKLRTSVLLTEKEMWMTLELVEEPNESHSCIACIPDLKDMMYKCGEGCQDVEKIKNMDSNGVV